MRNFASGSFQLDAVGGAQLTPAKGRGRGRELQLSFI